MASNTVIFYDMENIMGLFGTKSNTGEYLNDIYRKVLNFNGVTGVSTQRAYADWGMPMYHNLRGSILKIGIEPIHIFNTNSNDKIKNASDVCLIIDAVDFAINHPEVQNFVIASGDGIFAFLSKKLHQYGKKVIGCGFDSITNEIFRESCDHFISLEKQGEVLHVSSSDSNTLVNPPTLPIKGKKLNVRAIKRVNTRPHIDAKTSNAMALPKLKYTDALLEANISTPTDPEDVSGIMHTVRQLIEIFFEDDIRDENGIDISLITTYIKHVIPYFNVRKLGFKGMQDFFRFLLTGSKYCLHILFGTTVHVTLRTSIQELDTEPIKDMDNILFVTSDNERYNSIFNIPTDTPFIHIQQSTQSTNAPTKSYSKPNKFQQKTNNNNNKLKTKPLDKAFSIPSKDTQAPSIPTENIKHESTITDTKDSASIRKIAKDYFHKLESTDTLTASEIELLQTLSYSQTTFGVRAPILRKVDLRRNIEDQRFINDKVRYWKDTFEYHGKKYLIFKEWANIHRDRLIKWCENQSQRI